MKNKGSLHVWCVGYWEDGKFLVPWNLYHLKFYCENAYKFETELSQKFPDKNWKLISILSRRELDDQVKIVCIPEVADDEITNDGQKETTFDFQS